MEEKLDKLLDISDGGAASSSVVDVTDGASKRLFRRAHS